MVHALSPETGESLWTYTANLVLNHLLLLSGRAPFLGRPHGMLIALDVSTGESVWEFATGSSIVASPSVANRRIYIGTEDGILYCFGEIDNVKTNQTPRQQV